MRKLSADYRFNHFTYSMASMIEALATESSSMEEILWMCHEVVESIVKFSKITILHYYIGAWTQVGIVREYKKSEALEYDSYKFEQMFQDRGIPYIPFEKYFESHISQEIDFEPFDWFEKLEDSFYTLFDDIIEETFHLLFANRAFLLNFNNSLSEYLREGNVEVPEKFLTKKGVLKRKNIPVWVKKAVIFREHAKCAICHRDLSGTISTDGKVHFDHIVPLSKWGVNDPCNIQLLCSDCNQKKSDGASFTRTRYPKWWD